MAITVDTCGLSCPQPVLMFLNASKQEGADQIDVLVDNEASKENVSRAARNNGFQVEPIEQDNGVTRLEIRK